MNAMRAVIAVVAATLLFWLVVHQVSSLWLDVALRPEVRDALQRSLDDQKHLRSLDVAHRNDYRLRFESTSTLLHRLDVLRMNREQMLRRFELSLVALFAIVAAAVAAMLSARHRRAQQRERRDYLDRIAAVQDNARRSAHEMRGRLAAAQLELERGALESVAEELEALSRMSREYASFAAIATPVLRKVSLGVVVEEFCATFANAWPGVSLRFGAGDAVVCADRDMLRQVLVNLCSNSALAIDGGGSITFAISKRSAPVALDVADSGAGIAESLRPRVFDPYVTTRKTGQGTGLGLAISRKIMIDHGGDLELVASSSSGTTFRLIFGDNSCS